MGSLQLLCFYEVRGDNGTQGDTFQPRNSPHAQGYVFQWIIHNPAVLKIRLKSSKSDQVGQEIDLFIGRTCNSLCPAVGYDEISGSKRNR